MQTDMTFDVIIIGSGAAGLALALSLPHHTHIAIISKDQLTAGSSPHAQGGIAAVMNNQQDATHHIKDTLIAGAGLCNPDVVKFTVTQAQAALEWLMQQGVQFNQQSNQQLDLAIEAGHSQRRILHVADKTGSAVVKTLIQQVQSHANIHCLEQQTAIDLIVQDNHCYGLHVLHNLTGETHHYYAHTTVLATGGASQIYKYSTNPEVTSGDGIAMAYRAGAQTNSLEFNQFHPTSLYTQQNQKRFLISEAVRGEGALLLSEKGTRFMPAYDKRAELAPRDIVARAIVQQIASQKNQFVYLDLSPINKEKIKQHFPTIYQHCLSHNIDITQQTIPVVPAAHYTCGGVVTDLNAQTSIKQLYAIGEVACTGLHGANRLASNSLLECLVFARAAGQHIMQHSITAEKITVDYASKPFYLLDEASAAAHIQTIKNIMWQHVGIIRSHAGLKLAAKELQALSDQLLSRKTATCYHRKTIELNNMLHVAKLIVQAARKRSNNCGLHYNIDIHCGNATISHSCSAAGAGAE